MTGGVGFWAANQAAELSDALWDRSRFIGARNFFSKD